jgi:hypothetical protein
VTDERAYSSLPIVIGVESFGTLGNEGLLLDFFAGEFRAKRRTYPHSPLVVLPRAAAPLMEIVGRAAAASDVDIFGSDKRAAGPLTACCHALISVRRSRATGAGDATERVDPQQGSADGTAPGGDNIRLESRFHLELIEVLLGADSGYTVSRKWTAGIEFEAALGAELGDRALRRTDDFNRDAAMLVRRAADPTSLADNLALPNGASCAGECMRPLQVFAAADRLSTAYQLRVSRAFQTIFGLATTAAVLYGVFLIFGSGDVELQEWVLSIYLLTLLAAYGVYYRTKRQQLHDRFVEYRALAEGARVQFYWAACGLDKLAADCYLVRHSLELHWIRLALRWTSWEHGSEVERQSPLNDVQRVLLNWIGREKGYYARSSARSARAEARGRILVRAIFVLGVCATALVLLQSQVTPLVPFLKRISFVSFICPSIAAALVALIHKLGVVYRAQHHSRMLGLYAQAEQCTSRSAPAAASQIADALGVATLRESEEWTVFRRERRVDEPASPFRRPW